jgi:outer membrane biosynthesis protein TonB
MAWRNQRVGARGGRDQFNWDDVKKDKHRENYIGHTVNAIVGKDAGNAFWYMNEKASKQGDDALDEYAQLREEKRLFKEREDAMRREALGLPPLPAAKPERESGGSSSSDSDSDSSSRKKKKKKEKKKKKKEKKKRKKEKKKEKKKRKREQEEEEPETKTETKKDKESVSSSASSSSSSSSATHRDTKRPKHSDSSKST